MGRTGPSYRSGTGRSVSMRIGRSAFFRRRANYFVRLGWSHGDQEVFSTQEMIDTFSLEAVGRSPARFDFAKLENLNGQYIRATPDAELVEAIERILPEVGPARGVPSAR